MRISASSRVMSKPLLSWVATHSALSRGWTSRLIVTFRADGASNNRSNEARLRLMRHAYQTGRLVGNAVPAVRS